MSTAAYISQRCPNCHRFMEAVRQVPSLQQTLRVIDIDQTPNPGITHIPTVVDSSGAVMTGAKAFEWLKQFQSEVEYQPMQLSMGTLSYGSINDGGAIDFANGVYKF